MSLLAATNPQKKKTEMSVAKALLFFIGRFDSCKIEKALACTKAEIGISGIECLRSKKRQINKKPAKAGFLLS